MPVARVQMPDGRIGRFEVPEGMSPAEIEAFAASSSSQKENAPPADKSPGVPLAFAQSLSDAPGDLLSMIFGTPGTVLNTAAQAVGVKNPPFWGVPEVTKVIRRDKDLAMASLRNPTATMGELGPLADAFRRPPETPAEDVASFTGSIMGSGGINPKAVIETGLEYGPAAAGKLFASQGAASAAAGVTGGSAGELVDAVGGENKNPVAKMVAQILGAWGGSHVPEMVAPTTGHIAGSALKNTTTGQQNAAQELMNTSHEIGAPVTGAEALGAITGKNRLLDVQRVVEESPKGSEVMSPFMAERPVGNHVALGSVLDDISAAPKEPWALPSRMANAADSAIEQEVNARTKATSPIFQSAKMDQVPSEEIQAIINKIGALTDPTKGGVSSSGDTAGFLDDISTGLQRETKTAVEGPYGPMGPTTTKTTTKPETSAGTLNSALRGLQERLTGPITNPKTVVSAEAKGVAGPVLSEVGATIEKNSPGIKEGNALYEKISKKKVNPLKEGPVGSLAEGKTAPGQPANAENLIGTQREILMKKDPTTMTPDTIRQTIKIINKQDKTAAREWTRNALESNFNRILRADNKETAGGRFVKDIAGNPAQRKNLEALVTESTGSPDTWKGFNNFIKVMDAQHKRLPTGSQTASKLEIQRDLGSDAVSGTGVPGYETVKKFVDDFRYGRNTRKMAEILTDPASIKKLQVLAKIDAKNNRARMLAVSIITGAPEPSNSQDNNQNP